MNKPSDLVRDSELETHITPDYTVHVFSEPDPGSRKRAVLREEYWRRQKRIGGGAYGRVWLEKCKSGQREVELRAVKEIETSSTNTLDYNRELEAIAKFSHRRYERCFVKSFGWYKNSQALFIAMEYLEHGDLHSYLSSVPPLVEPEAKELTFQILEGLHFMHKNEFAHRDLKPANILIKSQPPADWWVKIGDFGISKRFEDNQQPATRTLKGTEGFIAPELYRLTSRGTDYAADIWALGEMAFQMLTKEPVFENLRLLLNYTQNPQCFPDSKLKARDVKDSVVDFISGSMKLLPEERFTAENALKHEWMKQQPPIRLLPPTRSAQNSISSSVDSISEQLASWTTVPAESHLPSSLHQTRPIAEPSAYHETIANDQPVVSSPLHQIPHIAEPSAYNETRASDQRVVSSQVSRTKAKIHHEIATRLRFSEEEDRQLKGFEGAIYSVAFSPDGALIATGGSGRFDNPSIRLWNVANGQQLWSKHGHRAPISFKSFDDGENAKLLQEDLPKRKASRAMLELIRPKFSHKFPTAFQSRNDREKANASQSDLPEVNLARSLKLFCETKTSDEIVHLPIIVEAAVSSAAAAAVAAQMICEYMSTTRATRPWEQYNAIMLTRILTENHGTTFTYNINSEFVSTIRNVYLQSTDSGVRKLLEETMASFCTEQADDPNFRELVDMWSEETGFQIPSGRNHKRMRIRPTGRSCLLPPEEVTTAVYCVAFSPDGKLLVSSGGSTFNDRPIWLWDVATGRRLRRLEGHTDTVKSIAFSHGGTLIACGGSRANDTAVWLWSATNGLQLGPVTGLAGVVNCFAFSPTSLVAAFGGDDKFVRLRNVANGRELNNLNCSKVVNCVAFSPDGKMIVSGEDEGYVSLWDAATSDHIRRLYGPTGAVYGVTFSSDGTAVVAGGEDKTLRIWDTATGSLLQASRHSLGPIYSVAFSPDNRLIVYAGNDEVIRIANVATMS